MFGNEAFKSEKVFFVSFLVGKHAFSRHKWVVWSNIFHQAIFRRLMARNKLRVEGKKNVHEEGESR
jgi:hypothetical protein